MTSPAVSPLAGANSPIILSPHSAEPDGSLRKARERLIPSPALRHEATFRTSYLSR